MGLLGSSRSIGIGAAVARKAELRRKRMENLRCMLIRAFRSRRSKLLRVEFCTAFRIPVKE